ncbi:MAG TPA: extensin family protein [Microvirga sp.]
MSLRPHHARFVLAAVFAGGFVVSAALAETPPAPPLPPPRPADAAPTPEAAPAPAGPAVQTSPRSADEAATLLAETCRNRITRLGVSFEPKPDVSAPSCGFRDAVLVSMLPDGVAVAPPALMTCPVAEGLARWTLDVLTLEADRHLGAAPVKLAIGTSYECRNQRSGSKLSEHAFGNAVDVMGVEFHKRAAVPITAHAAGTPEAAFQDAIRAGACATFTTVLGPGSDAAHGDHLHLDLRGRRGGYRICQ